MNAFVYIGSHREHSKTKDFTLKLFESLKEQCEIEGDLFTARDVEARECQGCCECFTRGKCNIRDDMDILKNSMLKSQIIIFASPVYLWQVTSNMKKIIDRISYWTHIFRLIGKIGVCINVSSSNGNEMVADYLQFVMEALGISVISNISLKEKELRNEAVYNSIIWAESKKILNRIKNNQFDLSSRQEEAYIALKKEMLNSSNSKLYEKEFWVRNKYFDCSSFEELYQRELEIK